MDKETWNNEWCEEHLEEALKEKEKVEHQIRTFENEYDEEYKTLIYNLEELSKTQDVQNYLSALKKTKRIQKKETLLKNKLQSLNIKIEIYEARLNPKKRKVIEKKQ